MRREREANGGREKWSPASDCNRTPNRPERLTSGSREPTPGSQACLRAAGRTDCTWAAGGRRAWPAAGAAGTQAAGTEGRRAPLGERRLLGTSHRCGARGQEVAQCRRQQAAQQVGTARRGRRGEAARPGTRTARSTAGGRARVRRSWRSGCHGLGAYSLEGRSCSSWEGFNGVTREGSATRREDEQGNHRNAAGYPPRPTVAPQARFLKSLPRSTSSAPPRQAGRDGTPPKTGTGSSVAKMKLKTSTKPSLDLH